MADVILPAAALDVAPADEHVGGIPVCGKGISAVVAVDDRPPGRGQQRVLEMDGVRPREVADEDAAGGDLRDRVVVVKAELRIRSHFRDDVQVGERTERPLFRGAAVVVVRTEVELIRGGLESSRGARAAVERKGVAAACFREETSRIGGRGTTANEIWRWIGFSRTRIERARAEIAATLQQRV